MRGPLHLDARVRCAGKDNALQPRLTQDGDHGSLLPPCEFGKPPADAGRSACRLAGLGGLKHYLSSMLRRVFQMRSGYEDLKLHCRAGAILPVVPGNATMVFKASFFQSPNDFLSTK